MNKIVVLSFLAMLSLLPACSGNKCENDRDCDSGTYCRRYVCTIDCRESRDCSTGMICSRKGKCLQPSDTTKELSENPDALTLDEAGFRDENTDGSTTNEPTFPDNSTTTCKQKSDCSTNAYCEDGRCISCATHCKLDETKCFGGAVAKCVPTNKCNKWQITQACNSNETCKHSVCVKTGCSSSGDCGTGETCVEGKCKPADPCANVKCNSGETCSNGKCSLEDPCRGVTCHYTQICEQGKCVDYGCASNADCKSPTGTCHNGSCQSCVSNFSCGSGGTCDPKTGICITDPCANITCPSGEICIAGACKSKQNKCSYDGDCNYGEKCCDSSGMGIKLCNKASQCPTNNGGLTCNSDKDCQYSLRGPTCCHYLGSNTCTTSTACVYFGGRVVNKTQCTSNYQCKFAEKCVGGVCRPKARSGQPCSYNDDCVSGLCMLFVNICS